MADFLSTLFGGGAQQQAAQQDISALNTYQGQALPALQSAYNTGTTALNQGIAGYQPLANLGAQYSSVAPTILGAEGVGTPQQNQAALTAFQQSNPSYQFQVDQANQAAQRMGIAGGGGGLSGNALIAADTYGQNLANTSYQQWLQNLQNTGNAGLQATSQAAAGQLQGQGALANLASQYGQNQSNVYGNVAQGTVAANNLAAAGEQQGANNLLGAGLSLASLALAPATGGLSLGAGAALSGLGSAASSGASSAYGSLMGQQWQQNNPGAWGSSYFGPVAPGS